MNSRFEIQGHRGARGVHPENTLPSFEAALDAGVHSVETDLHLTKDGVPVLAHDPVISERLCRLADSGVGPAPELRPRIAELTLAELRGYVADVNPDPRRFPDQTPTVTPLARRFADEHDIEPYAIPTLAGLFAFVAAYAGPAGQDLGKTDAQQATARQLWFDLELKRVPYHPENQGDGYTGRGTARLEDEILAAIQAAGLQGRTRVRSFDHRCIHYFKQGAPEIEVAVLVADTMPVVPAELARAAGADVYCPSFEFLDAEAVQSLHAAGLRVLPWTVNRQEDWARLITWGVDGITTDFPDRLTAFLRTFAPTTSL
jgi:glycerophosphoryl diester phosphodiesterase